VLLDEAEAGDERVVPGDAVEREDEGEDVEDEFDAEDLRECRGLVMGSGEWVGETRRTGKAINMRMAMPAATAMAACL
jgi:hypothetical protein